MTHGQIMQGVIEAGEKATNGDGREVAWQKFGKSHYLTGQYGHRPIYLAPVDNELCTLDFEHTLLRPLKPEHPTATFIAQAANARETFALAAEIVKAAGELRALDKRCTTAGIEEYRPVCQRLDALLAKWRDAK